MTAVVPDVFHFLLSLKFGDLLRIAFFTISNSLTPIAHKILFLAFGNMALLVTFALITPFLCSEVSPCSLPQILPFSP
ncbi:hypothetical protein [Prevotella sp.]|uniref:hypothetical protein n=1 Tax=Prevotella sp. TaxID=59823 RepID=UPI0040299D3E